MASTVGERGWPRYPDLAGKVALITGSSRGIGAATSRLLALNGARVVVSARDEGALAATVAAIREAGGEATGLALDLAQSNAPERLREEAERSYGPVDVLGALVGGSGRPPEPTADIRLETGAPRSKAT